jgi:hypothetical protein
VKWRAGFLLVAGLGAALLLMGLALDSYLHARDPTLAHREGVFTLDNPGHILLGAGIALVVAGLVAAAYVVLPPDTWSRRALIAGALALVLTSGATVGWAASVERATHLTVAVTSDHHGSAGGLDRPVTALELEAATRLLTDTKAAVAKYADQSVAIADGYQPGTPPALPIVHFINGLYLGDGLILQPERVESLIYWNSDRGPVLVGAMYIMPDGMAGPQIGGPLTKWHHHENLCFDDSTGMVVAMTGEGPDVVPGLSRSQACPKGSRLRVTADMLHVWIVDNPKGPFDTDMDLAALRAQGAATPRR